MTARRASDLAPRFWSLPAVSFYVALCLTPLAVALIGVALIPVIGLGLIVLFSIPFGLPSYLLAGAPMFWLRILGGRSDSDDFLVAGFFANLAAAPATVLVLAAFGNPLEAAMQIALFLHGFGLIFAPIYGLIFGWIFRWLVDPTALPPAPPARDDQDLQDIDPQIERSLSHA